jgi:hypothetical protein
MLALSPALVAATRSASLAGCRGIAAFGGGAAAAAASTKLTSTPER